MKPESTDAGTGPVDRTVRQLAHGSDEQLTLIGSQWNLNFLSGQYRADVLAFGRACMEAERARTLPLVQECRDALAEELGAWDIDPPLHHVKQAHDKCEAWLLNAAISGSDAA